MIIYSRYWMCNCWLGHPKMSFYYPTCNVIDVIRLFGGNLDFPKIKKLKNVWSESETAQKCENNAIFKQIYTIKLFIAFKIVYS